MTIPPRPAASLLAALALLATPCAGAQDPYSDPAAAEPASDPCVQPGRNIQCTAFGSIAMDNQRDIRGEPISVAAEIWLNSNLADQGARWILFSVRNVTGEGSEPISLSLLRFATPNGEIVTTRVDHDKPNEIDLWVDVLDAPVATPITLEVQAGSSERGAYRLEALVLAFDRGYVPLKDAYGADQSLFAATLLGVNKETGKIENAGGGTILQGKKTVAPALPALLGALGLAAVALRRRRA